MALYRQAEKPREKLSLVKAMAALDAGEVSAPSDKASKADKTGKKTAFAKIKAGLEEILEIAKSDPKHGAESMPAIPAVCQPYHAPRGDADFASLLRLSGLTGAAFSRKTGTPLPTVKDWSRGKSPASGAALSYLRLVCAVKGCSSIEQVRAEIERAGSK